MPFHIVFFSISQSECTVQALLQHFTIRMYCAGTSQGFFGSAASSQSVNRSGTSAQAAPTHAHASSQGSHKGAVRSDSSDRVASQKVASTNLAPESFDVATLKAASKKLASSKPHAQGFSDSASSHLTARHKSPRKGASRKGASK